MIRVAIAINRLSHCAISGAEPLQKSTPILGKTGDIVCATRTGRLKNEGWLLLLSTQFLEVLLQSSISLDGIKIGSTHAQTYVLQVPCHQTLPYQRDSL